MTTDLLKAVKKGEIEKAKEIYFKLLPIAYYMEAGVKFYPRIKAAVELLGRPAGPPRNPVSKIMEQEREELKTLLKNAELLK
jgi:4-hydroxy-tetrahydrodipicolinate synthase